MENLPKRKSTRLKDFNYSSNATYFLTICTQEMKCMLSDIVGVGVLDDPKVVLTNYGRIVNDRLLEMDRVYKDISLLEYIIMPNHIHLLISIKKEESGLSGSSGTPTPTNSLIARYVSTLKRMTNKDCNCKLWQRGSYDRIIRDEDDYLIHVKYINDNPAKWAEKHDEYYV